MIENPQICKRYKLPHGIGILLGYEHGEIRGPDGKFLPRYHPKWGHMQLYWGKTTTYSFARHIFRIEADHSWSFNKHNDRYSRLYFCRLDEVEELDCE